MYDNIYIRDDYESDWDDGKGCEQVFVLQTPSCACCSRNIVTRDAVELTDALQEQIAHHEYMVEHYRSLLETVNSIGMAPTLQLWRTAKYEDPMTLLGTIEIIGDNNIPEAYKDLLWSYVQEKNK